MMNNFAVTWASFGAVMIIGTKYSAVKTECLNSVKLITNAPMSAITTVAMTRLFFILLPGHTSLPGDGFRRYAAKAGSILL